MYSQEKQIILVIDDNNPPGQRHIMKRLVNDRLGALGHENDCECVTCEPDDKTTPYDAWIQEEIENLAHEYNDQILAAMINLNLSPDFDRQDGLQITRILKDSARNCFTILLAGHTERSSIRDIRKVDKVISLGSMRDTLESQMHHALVNAFRSRVPL